MLNGLGGTVSRERTHDPQRETFDRTQTERLEKPWLLPEMRGRSVYAPGRRGRRVEERKCPMWRMAFGSRGDDWQRRDDDWQWMDDDWQRRIMMGLREYAAHISSAAAAI